MHSLHLHGSPAERGPFPYSCCKTKPEVARTLEGGKSMARLGGSPGLTAAVSLAGCHRLKKQAEAADLQKPSSDLAHKVGSLVENLRNRTQSLAFPALLCCRRATPPHGRPLPEPLLSHLYRGIAIHPALATPEDCP